MKEFLNLLIEELKMYNDQEIKDCIDRVSDLCIH